jgi:hypothetical protein
VGIYQKLDRTVFQSLLILFMAHDRSHGGKAISGHGVLAPAVKLSRIQVARTEVIVHDSQDHPQPGLMRGLDKLFEAGWTTIGRY